jgi:release factor glutamine methyltransferase
MEIQAVKKMIKDTLSPYYPREEIRSFINLIFEHLLGMSEIKTHLNQSNSISEAKLTEIVEILERLKNFEPIQYILGETEFYGLKFKVNHSALIPRPETEELVDWILKDSPNQNAAILDIGTGSGCIAIALAKNRPDLDIEGWDLSNEALILAKQNGLLNDVTVEFKLYDILNWRIIPHDKKYDLIVSNPPYVTKSEQSLLSPNVIDNEPHLALFVPDEDPLIFFRAIMDFANAFLNPYGSLYFEINEKLGTDVMKMFESQNYLNIELRKDINGRDRMVRCVVQKRNS